MQPLQTLLKPAKAGEKWADQWRQEQQSTLRAATKIVEKIKYFTLGMTTTLVRNWSRIGMGFHLTQKHCVRNTKVLGCYMTRWKTVLAGSKFTRGAES